MRHRCWILCLTICLAVAAPLAAQVVLPSTVYVSTGPAGGNQIIVLNNADTTTPAPQVLCTGSTAFNPEDMVVGPDGLLYVANTSAGQIWRLNPATLGSAACDADNGTSSELIFSSATRQPEGPTFVSEPTNTVAGSLDLLFNTRNGQGVWKLTGIASVAIGCGTGCATATKVVDAPQSTTAGAGTKVGKRGDLLAVDGTGSLFKYSFPYSNTSTSFISGLNSPSGVAINTCGDILVATNKTVSRYNGNTGALLDSLPNFGGNNHPKFLEVDSSNHIYLITAKDDTGASGVAWRFDPPTTNPLTSCSLKSFTLGYSIALKTTLGLASSNGLGVAVSASSATSQVQCFTPASPTNLYNFGTHSVEFTIANLTNPVCLQITAVKSRPTDGTSPEVTFSPAPPFSCPAAPTSGSSSFKVPAPVCLHYASDGGFCTQYLEQAFQADKTTKITDAQLNSGTYCSGGACDFRGLMSYFTLDKINFPGGAHVSTDNQPSPIILAYGSGNPTDDCQTLYFFPGNGGNGLDPTYTRGTNSKHVVFNSNTNFGPFQIVLGSPTVSCDPNGVCNPQFNSNSNIAVKFTFLNSTFNSASERLSIMRVQHTTKGVTTTEQVVENVVPTNNSSFQNFFDANGSGQYSYGADVSAFQRLPKGSVAIYQLTIWGNASLPFSFFVGVQF